MLKKGQPISYVTKRSVLDKVLHSFRIQNKELRLLLSKNLETGSVISPARYFQIVAWESIKFKYSLQSGNCLSLF